MKQAQQQERQLAGVKKPALEAAGILIWIIGFSLMMQPLSTDFYLASLPFIGTAFSVSAAQVQDTLTYFAVGFGLAQILVGPITDYVGRRPALLCGALLFSLASVLCALAIDMRMLVAGRILQAVGCCTAVLVARAIIRDAFSLAEAAQVMAKASTILAIGPLFGPILGGYLQAWFGWQATFVTLVLFGLMLLALVWFHLPETLPEKNADALRPSYILWAYADIARSPAFWRYALPGALSYAALFVFLSGASQIQITVLHVPPQYFGYLFALGVIGYISGTMSCQRLLPRLGVDATMKLGTTLALGAGLAFVLLVVFGVQHWSTIVIGHFLVVFAHGITFPCSQAGATRPFPERAGYASGLSGFLAMVFAIVTGLAVAHGFDGTMLPMSLCSLTLAVLIFLSGRLPQAGTSPA